MGNPNIRGTEGGLQPYQFPHPVETAPIINKITGIVSIWWSQALQNGTYGNNPNAVRMFAKWPNADAQEAIKSLIRLANEDALLYGFSGEFPTGPNGLSEIGLYLDRSESIYTWIERIQSGNVLGGQLMVVANALHFRLENPNRNKILDIPSIDAQNHEFISVQVADDFMYSGWEISWHKSWGDSETASAIGTNYRYPTAPILSVDDLTPFYERTESPDPIPDRPVQVTQGFNTSALNRRVGIIRDSIATFRHKIDKLILPMTHAYLDLLIYDVIGYTPRVLEEVDQNRAIREWIIYEKQYDFTAETISLSLIERLRSNNWNNGNP